MNPTIVPPPSPEAVEAYIRSTLAPVLPIHELPVGLHPSVPPETYYARVLGIASKSSLDLVHHAPSVYRAWIEGAEEESTVALDFGKAFHCAALEPDRFVEEYFVEPDFGDMRSSTNRKKRDEWRSEHPLHVSPSDFRTIWEMSEAMRRHPLLGRMMREGQRELTLRWDDEPTGIICKARLDWYVEELSLVMDLKQTGVDARPRPFTRDVATYRYHVQEAFYRYGMQSCGHPVDHFIFVVVEREPPYLIGLYALDASTVQAGADAYRRNLDTLAQCLERDEWPGLSESIETIQLPRWARDER